MIISLAKKFKKIAFSAEGVCFAIFIGYFVYLFHPFFFYQLFPVPLDTIVGLYHPWRDFNFTQFPSGIPFKNFLVTDSIRQLIPWRELAINLLKSNQSPVWNPYNFAGYGLSGNFQTAAYYPLNLIFVAVPFLWGWSIQVLLQVVFGAFFMAVFLKRILGQTIPAIFGAMCWVGSGFFTAWMAHNTLIHAAIWVPLALYASEEITSKKYLKGALLWVISLTCLSLAGAPQIALYGVCFVVIYHLCAVLKKTLDIRGLVATIFGLITSIFLAWPQINASLIFLSENVRSVSSLAWKEPGWFLPWQNLLQFFAPDFYGNPSTLNYFGVWNYMEFVGYIGIVGLVFVGFGIFSKNLSQKIFFLGSAAVTLCLMLPNPISALPYLFHLPIFSLGQPTRLMFIVDLSLAVLAASGLQAFLQGEPKPRSRAIWLAGFSLVAASLFFYTFFFQKNPVSEKNLILPLVMTFAMVTILFIWKRLQRKAILLSLLFLITAFDLSRFGTKFISFSPEKYFFPETEVTTFLRNKTASTYARIVSLDDEIMPANISSHYGLYSLDGYDSLMPKNFIDLVDAFETGAIRSNSAEKTNRILRIRNSNSRLLDLFGVRYVLTFGDLDNKRYRLVKVEGKTKVYENLTALPKAFFVSEIRNFSNSVDELNFLIGKDFSPEKIATVQSVADFTDKKFLLGTSTIVKYSPTEIIVKTVNDGDGFLVLSDNYSRFWQTTVDGKNVKTYQVDHSIRGVPLTKGEHIVKMFIKPL